jgi:hypothetical protein
MQSRKVMGARSLRVRRSSRSIGSAPLRGWYFSHPKLTIFFRRMREADIDHGHAGHRALLQELLRCGDEAETAAARFDHVLGRDPKRQILD